MSEPMFPTSSDEVPVVEAGPEKKSNRTALLAVGGVVAALAVGAGAFFLLAGSGSGGEDEGAPVAAKPKASAPVVPAASPSKAAAPVKTVVVAGRDPFAVLFPAPAAGAGTTSDSSGTTASEPSPAPSVASQSQTTTSTLILTAVDAKKGTATIAIDGKRYSAVIGTPFATYYQLYAVFNTKCAGFLVGDVSVPVCIGTAASVTH